MKKKTEVNKEKKKRKKGTGFRCGCVLGSGYEMNLKILFRRAIGSVRFVDFPFSPSKPTFRKVAWGDATSSIFSVQVEVGGQTGRVPFIRKPLLRLVPCSRNRLSPLLWHRSSFQTFQLLAWDVRFSAVACQPEVGLQCSASRAPPGGHSESFGDIFFIRFLCSCLCAPFLDRGLFVYVLYV